MSRIVVITATLLLAVPASAQVNLGKINRQPARIAPARPSAAEVETAAWQVCANARTVGPCTAYLRDYPSGSYRRAAASRIGDLNGGPEAATTVSVAPVAAAPAVAVAAAAPVAAVVAAKPIKTDRNAERAAWTACEAGTTTEPCAIYVAQFAQGRRIRDARRLIEKRNSPGAETAMFNQCQAGTTTAPCDIYAARFPQGRHILDARRLIETRNVAGAETAVFAQCQAGKTAAVCEDFIRRYPKSPLVGAARTQIGFITARAARRGGQ